MESTLIISIASAFVTIALGGITSFVGKLIGRNPDSRIARILERLGLVTISEVEVESVVPDGEKLRSALEDLQRASNAADAVIRELTHQGAERARTVERLGQQLDELTLKETELKAKIETLEKVPLPALQHFEEVLRRGDRRSAKRDYLLFGFGALVSTIVSIIIQLWVP